jgi:hypothetical protein
MNIFIKMAIGAVGAALTIFANADVDFGKKADGKIEAKKEK